VAESLAAKSVLTPPKESKPEHSTIQPIPEPATARDKVVSWHS
jgi:hypothetical protein